MVDVGLGLARLAHRRPDRSEPGTSRRSATDGGRRGGERRRSISSRSRRRPCCWPPKSRTRDRRQARYREAMERAYGWFLGGNDLGIEVADPGSGRRLRRPDARRRQREPGRGVDAHVADGRSSTSAPLARADTTQLGPPDDRPLSARRRDRSPTRCSSRARLESDPDRRRPPVPGELRLQRRVRRRVDDETILLLRVEDLRGISQLHVARSADGDRRWRFDPEPLLRSDADTYPEEIWGCEDPRLTWLPEREEWAIAYTAYSRRGPLVSLAMTTRLPDRAATRAGDAARGQGRGPVPAPVRRSLGDDPSSLAAARWGAHVDLILARPAALGRPHAACSRRATAPGGMPARSVSGRRRSRRRTAG